MELPERKWVTVREVAEHLDTSKPTIYRLVRNGILSAIRIKKCIRILREDVLNYESRIKIRPY